MSGSHRRSFSSAQALPLIRAQLDLPADKGRILRMTVRNESRVPQYQLQVYATISDRRGYLAAGRATVAHLGTGASTSVQMTLLGSETKAAPALPAPPTIFG